MKAPLLVKTCERDTSTTPLLGDGKNRTNLLETQKENSGSGGGKLEAGLKMRAREAGGQTQAGKVR